MSHTGLDDYWRTLLSDFNKVTFGEDSAMSAAPCQISLETNIGNSGTTLDHVRHAALLAWAFVLSQHAGVDDVIMIEIYRTNGLDYSLIPRRIQLASKTAPSEQIALQIQNDSFYAPFQWAQGAEIGITGVYSSIQIASSEEGALPLWTNGEASFHQNDTTPHLSVAHSPEAQNVSLLISFNPSAFHKTDAQYMLDHFSLALQQMLHEPKKSLECINMMSAQEQLFTKNLPSIVEVNNLIPPEDPSRYSYAQELFKRQVLIRPDAVAIEWEGQPAYTYAFLDSASSKLAWYLSHNHGIGPGDVVIIFSEHSPLVVVAIYALLKAGAAYLPIDVEAPGELIKHATNMVNSKLLLTLTSLEPTLDVLSLAAQIVSLDDTASEWLAVDDQLLDHYKPQLGDPKMALAYVNLTSGSTGLPKGCMVTHSNLVNWIVEATPGFGRTSETRTLQICKLQFDGIVEEIFMTHYQGGTLCMASPLSIESSLKDVINTMGVTMITLTPTRASLLEPTDVPSLSTIVLTGEPLRRFARERWVQEGKRVYNAFGPTETICCFMLENPVCSSESNETPCGLTLNKSSRVYCMDSSLQTVPVGCVGEICVSGPSVGLGYFGNDNKSQEVYVIDPFRPNYRMYRTGDLGRVNYEGRLSFVGRRDQQIKLHGNRIELGGIEAVLSAADSIWSTCADIVNFRGGPRLAAFIALKSRIGSHQDMSLTLTSEARLEAERLSEFAASKLPQSSIPTLWVPVDAFPMTISGKLNRKAIKQFFHRLSDEDRADVGDFLVTRGVVLLPTSAIEIQLQGIWSSCLNIPPERIGIHNSLFDLGADSLGTLRLAATLNKAGFPVTPIQLRQLQTVKKVATALSENRERTTSPTNRPVPVLSKESMADELAQLNIAMDDVDLIVPVTPFQKGVLLHPSDAPDSFMSVMRFTVTENIATDKFISTLEYLGLTHPILRTAFIVTSNSAYPIAQVVLKHPPPVIVHNDIRAQESQFKSFSEYHWGRVAFNFVLLHEAEGPAELLFYAHHALFDGWSIRLLLSDMMKKYSGYEVLRPSWHDFVAYTWAADTEPSFAFWEEYLRGTPKATFCQPKSLPDSGVASQSRTFNIDLSQSSQILQQTDSVLMYAAWSLVQFIHTNEDDIVFNVVSSGRDAPVDQVLDMMGPCLTHSPLRVKFSKISTIQALLQSVQDALFAIGSHGVVGTSAIMKTTGNSNGAVLSNVDFVFQDIDSVFEVSQEEMWIRHKSSNLDSATPMTIQVQTLRDRAGFEVSASYDRSAVSSQEVDYMLNQFGYIVELALGQPETTLTPANFVSARESEQVILGNPDAEPLLSVIDMFMSRVREQPDDLAVEMDGGSTLTYSELNACSSAYATELLAMQLEPERPVLVHLEKGLSLVVTVLACFKAGICFCMVSPDCPVGRMQIIIEDIKPQYIISPNLDAGYPVPVLVPVFVGGSSLRCPTDIVSPVTKISPNSLAWIMMTSGTTGRPKPIGFCRSNLDAFASGDHSHRRYRRSLNFASVHFDASIEDIFTTICHGGCLCLASDTSLRQDLPGVIRRMNIQVASLTPTVAKLLVGERFDTLETLMLGGESHSPYLRDRLLETGITGLQSGYGPSECTVKCFMDVMDAKAIATNRPVTLGKVFGHNLAVVLDEKLRPVPFGAVGELFIGGPQVSTGYVNQPDKTANAFITVELPPGHQTRWYRSGDMVRLLPNRSLEFRGRKDRQVKIRGQRVELSDIEACVLDTCPSVAQVAVISVTDSTGAQSLIAFVTMKDGTWLNIPDSLERLRERSTVIPSEMVVIDRLPVNASGKLDSPGLENIYAEHRKFTSAEPSSVQAETSIIPEKSASPLSKGESLVRTLWAKVLSVPESVISLDVAFSDIGGDSFKWMQLSQAFVRAKTRIALTKLMAAQTIRKQALLIP